jgi:hypothetical protein
MLRKYFVDLKSAFDERSIFPKYILDYEAKQRQLFEAANPQQQQQTSVSIVNPPVQTRQPTDVLSKIKRQSSSSTLLSDQKAQ